MLGNDHLQPEIDDIFVHSFSCRSLYLFLILILRIQSSPAGLGMDFGRRSGTLCSPKVDKGVGKYTFSGSSCIWSCLATWRLSKKKKWLDRWLLRAFPPYFTIMTNSFRIVWVIRCPFFGQCQNKLISTLTWKNASYSGSELHIMQLFFESTYHATCKCYNW